MERVACVPQVPEENLCRRCTFWRLSRLAWACRYTSAEWGQPTRSVNPPNDIPWIFSIILSIPWLSAGATLIVVGERRMIQAFKQLMAQGSG